MNLRPFQTGLALLVLVSTAGAWDFEGHRVVNQLALASLPAEFPGFVREPGNAERIAWLSAEPDRWRSAPELPARHVNAPDHYINFELLHPAGLDDGKVSSFRYEFVAQFAAGRAANPTRFETIDPARNQDRTREWPGFLPWSIAEYFGKLRGDFARLKVWEEFGDAAEAARTRESIVELMGIMGHFVGDAAQPLHTTIHHNGWVGDNPAGFTLWRGFHAWIDGGFLLKTGGLDLAALRPRVAPAKVFGLGPRSADRDPAFALAWDYVLAQHQLVGPLYELEKAGQLKGEDAAANRVGREFLEVQLLRAGQMLGSLWLTAWRTTPPDAYLRGVLLKQQAAAAPATTQP